MPAKKSAQKPLKSYPSVLHVAITEAERAKNPARALNYIADTILAMKERIRRLELKLAVMGGELRPVKARDLRGALKTARVLDAPKKARKRR
jgi:hypothetical protein